MGALVRWDVQLERSLGLLEGAMAWLQSQTPERPSQGCLASWVKAEVERPREAVSRVAWCYGDLGGAMAVLLAARAAKRADWEAFALTMARFAAERPLGEAGVNDAGLCHGAAGNAQIFFRLHGATGEIRFRERALEYLDAALAMHLPGQGIGGWRAYHPGEDGDDPEPMKSVPGVLEGAAGIGLAFLSFLEPKEPAWDRFMLLSHRQPGNLCENVISI